MYFCKYFCIQAHDSCHISLQFCISIHETDYMSKYAVVIDMEPLGVKYPQTASKAGQE